jgi:anti-sigma factor RsiW
MTSERHYSDEIQDLLDGRLEKPVAAEVEAHLARCARCSAERRAIESVRGSLRALPVDPLPGDALEAVRRSLATDTGESRRSFLLAAVAAVLAGVAAALGFRFWSKRDLVEAVAADLERYDSGELALASHIEDPPALEQWFVETGIDFRTRVFDLGMMGYRVRGGSRHRLASRDSALFVYESEGGAALLCQMFRGRMDELPPSSETRYNDGIPFAVHRRGATTLVFWPEGEVLCVLASRAPAEDVIQLAIAKAVRV